MVWLIFENILYLVYLALSHFFLEAIVQVDIQFRPFLSSAQSAKSPLLKLQSKSKFVYCGLIDCDFSQNLFPMFKQECLERQLQKNNWGGIFF